LASCAIFALGIVSDKRYARVLPSLSPGQEGQNMTNETYKHIRTNENTGEKDYYFPMEITCSEARSWARDKGFEVGKTRIGFRTIEAAMVPCKEVKRDSHGMEIYVETPSDVQRERYLAFIKDEMDAQEDIKEDGRCIISDGKGGTRRCPCRIANPNYAPGNGQPKTLPVNCVGCRNEPFKNAHSQVSSALLDHTCKDGRRASYEPESPASYFEGDRYLRMRDGFVSFVRERDPELAALALLLTAEYSKSEIAAMTSDPRTTIVSRAKKLMGLAHEYLDSTEIK